MAQHSVRPAASGVTKSGELKIADLYQVQGQGLTDRYDHLLMTLCGDSVADISATINTSDIAIENSTRFCHHIRHALNADTAYLCNRNSLTIVATSSSNSSQDSCEDTQELHAALMAMVSDLWNCAAPLCPPDIKVFPDEPNFSYCVVPLDTERDHLLVMVNPEVDQVLIGDYITDALTSVYRTFLQANENTPVETTLQSTVMDALHSKYKLSSKVVSKRRHEIFCRQVKESVAEFEGLTIINKKDKPDPLCTVLPEELYDAAALWDNTANKSKTAKFKATLDNHCLLESVYGYKTLCDNENLSKFSDGRSLKIRIHAETLSDYSFIETLTDLTEKAVIHPSKLEFSIVPTADEDFTDALQCLCNRFGIPTPSKSIETTQSLSIADGFDVMQMHGVNKPAKVRKIKN